MVNGFDSSLDDRLKKAEEAEIELQRLQPMAAEARNCGRREPGCRRGKLNNVLKSPSCRPSTVRWKLPQPGRPRYPNCWRTPAGPSRTSMRR